MSRANVDTIRQGQEGFSRGDLGPVKGLVSDEVEWGAVGAFPGLDGVYRGRDAMDEWMEAVRSSWEDFDVSLDAVLHDSDDKVVVIERLRGRGRESRAEVEMRIFSVYWFERGKIVKRLAFTDEDQALEAAGLDGGDG